MAVSEQRSIEEKVFDYVMKDISLATVGVCRKKPNRQKCELFIERSAFPYDFAVNVAWKNHNEERIFARYDDLGPWTWKTFTSYQDKWKLNAYEDIRCVKSAFGKSILKHIKRAFREKSNWIEIRWSGPSRYDRTIARIESLEKLWIEIDLM